MSPNVTLGDHCLYIFQFKMCNVRVFINTHTFDSVGFSLSGYHLSGRDVLAPATLRWRVEASPRVRFCLFRFDHAPRAGLSRLAFIHVEVSCRQIVIGHIVIGHHDGEAIHLWSGYH